VRRGEKVRQCEKSHEKGWRDAIREEKRWRAGERS
jgi:hypothetical protein